MPRHERNRPRRPFKNNYNNKFNKKPHGSSSNKEYQRQNQLSETDVGITQFLSKLDGFPGVIKARFSDFQLNEIDLDGNIAKLTDQRIPDDFNKKQQGNEELRSATNSPLDIIPQETWVGLKSIIESKEKISIELNVNEMSKDDRTKIHVFLREAFGRKIMGTTTEKDGKKVMIFTKFDGKDDRFKWPEDKGEYVHFLVYKECLDTLEACLKIADCVRIPAANFNYAGVKDKRAKTTQWFSVRKVEPWKLLIKTKHLRNNVKIGNITFKDHPIKLGQLKGNKFRIALRNVVADDDLIEKAVENLKKEGFINYYGLQRFGNDKEVPTFAIGVELLKGNWKGACEIILKPTQSDDPNYDVSKAKKVYLETGDAGKALEKFEGSRNKCIEYLLLSGLNKEKDNDYVNALSSIPRNTRLLYIHSFQSLVWNNVVSKRIEKYGLEVIPGDLILLEDSQNLPENGEAAESEENEETDLETETNRQKIKVKQLSAEECSKYSIYDIVLPLPGYDIIYPEYLKEFYQEILEKYGLTTEMTKQKVQTYTLSGTYRKMLGRVNDLNWKIMLYNDPNYNLIRSDLEELRKFEEPKSVEGGKYKALILEFSLTSSSYATMVLREILKTDTSSSAHAKLNNYAEPEVEKNNETETEIEEFDNKIGLLNDKDKYDAFKSIVFQNNISDTNLKRSHENGNNDDGNIDENAKKAKVDE